MSKISEYVQIQGTPEARSTFLRKLERLRDIEETAKQVMQWLHVEVRYIGYEGDVRNSYISDVEELKKALAEEKCE